MNENQERRIWNEITPNWIAHIRETAGDEGDIARASMLNSVMFDLMGDLGGKRVIDLGCGEGYLPRMMARRGAKVTGFDVADNMLAEARRMETANQLGIEYVRGSIFSAPEEFSGAFDVAVSNLVFNILPNHEAAFRSSIGMIKRGGLLVVSIVHPAFDDVGPGWVATTDGEVRWSANRYFERVNGRAASGSPSFHRCLSDYFSAGMAAGGILAAFKEPIYTGDLERSLPPDRRANARIPFVAVMRFERSHDNNK